MTLRLSPEEAIVVEAAGGAPPAAPVVERSGPIDWHQVLDLAAWHRLLPLLWRHLAAHEDGADVPTEVREELRRHARETTARNLQLDRQLHRVLAALGGAGIPVVLLKGAALVEAVYHQEGLRPMVDLDLLVARDDVGRAFDVVQALGYDALAPQVRERDDDAWLASFHHHMPLVKEDGSTVVELHHRILRDRPQYDVAGVWARATPSDRPPAHLLPAPEDLFLHVAVHFALDRIDRRGQSGLGQLADLVHICRRWDLDWEAVSERARASEVADRLFLALDAVAVLFGDLAPPAVLADLTPASYSARRGELFVRDRVLRIGPALPLEQLAGGRRRLFGVHTLEVYVRPGDVGVPSKARLRARRFASIAGRAARLVRQPRRLADDIQLSRWMVRLRG